MILRFIVVAFVYHDFVDGYPDDCGCYDHHEGYGCHDDADGFPQFRQNATPVEHESGMRRDDHRIMKMIGLKRTTLMFKPHDLAQMLRLATARAACPANVYQSQAWCSTDNDLAAQALFQNYRYKTPYVSSLHNLNMYIYIYNLSSRLYTSPPLDVALYDVGLSRNDLPI